MGSTNHRDTVWVIHGPNLNRLGEREPDVYGRTTLSDIDEAMARRGEELGIIVSTFQSNHEGEIVSKIQEIAGAVSGLIINPAAYTHTSIAIRDALLLLDSPIIEVHLTNIYKREPFRHTSMVSDVATGKISGLGVLGYRLALEALAQMISGQE